MTNRRNFFKTVGAAFAGIAAAVYAPGVAGELFEAKTPEIFLGFPIQWVSHLGHEKEQPGLFVSQGVRDEFVRREGLKDR